MRKLSYPAVFEPCADGYSVCFPDLVECELDNRRVRTNVTLPAWLKAAAEKRKVNYSQILEAALVEYLGIS